MVTVVRLLVDQGVDGNVGDIIGTDEWDLTVLAGGKDLVHLADGVYKARLRKVVYFGV